MKFEVTGLENSNYISPLIFPSFCMQKFIFREKCLPHSCHCKAMILIFMRHMKIKLATLWLHIREMSSRWPLDDVEHVSATSAVPTIVPDIVSTQCASVKKVIKYIATFKFFIYFGSILPHI